jgi:Ser/Thr protein kinase RdoA (MazF antagonist)
LVRRAPRQIAKAIREIRDTIASLATRHEWESLPRQWLHGDPSPENCINDASRGLCLIDLDDAHWGYRLWDVARAAAEVGAILPRLRARTSRFRDHCDQVLASELIIGFTEVVTLSDPERRACTASVALAAVALGVELMDLSPNQRHVARELPNQVECVLVAMRAMMEMKV